MRLIKNFVFVVGGLISDLWLGMGFKPKFYDNHTSSKTKVGYVCFVVMAAVISLTVVVWLGNKIR
ncbi:hypothetical protein DNH61_02505 [Paenibacillus sambharensis]|uniref:Uncharacterized protein n=1 Tax=Paenibacillus sambharensis TaxID=1803190 RepID=A0A2W1LF26_9BACL|nr:hypothetical protein DNH61_02505 [Paenibacillus sambharensis]